MLIICMKEEPLQSNCYLHALIETTGAYSLSTIKNDKLNRYSFAYGKNWNDRQEGYEQFTKLLSNLPIVQKTPGMWLSAWTDNAGGIDFTIRSKVAASKKRKTGWTVNETKGLSVAKKNIDTTIETIAVSYLFYNFSDGVILCFGNIPSSQIFTEFPLRPSMEAFALRGKFAPSEQLFNWLVENHVTLMYGLTEEIGTLRLIVVSPDIFDINSLVKQGLVEMTIDDDVRK